MMYNRNFLWALALTILQISHCLSAALENRDPTCTDFIMPVTISALNAQVNQSLPLGELLLGAVGSTFNFTVPVHGTYSISARYCEPRQQDFTAQASRWDSRRNALQLLVHGLTYNKNYWSGDGPPGHGFDGDEYSWVSYAASQGYPTLAIDRLGSGNSSHPDPVLVRQTPAEMEILHQVIQAARTAKIPAAGRAFSQIIIAGHSYGSLLSNALNQKYPNDVDATILTGYSKFFNSVPELNAIFKDIDILPASDIPADANLPSGYWEIGSYAGDLDLFYHDGYDPALAAYDYSLRGALTTGELLSLLYAPYIATSYTRPVYVVTGQNDFLMCNPNGTANGADCSLLRCGNTRGLVA